MGNDSTCTLCHGLRVIVCLVNRYCDTSLSLLLGWLQIRRKSDTRGLASWQTITKLGAVYRSVKVVIS